MALGKYTRVDNRRSPSSYCSTVSIVVFVALCLVGVWMMTSSSVVPVQNGDVPQENNDEAKQRVSGNNDGNTLQFEDKPGDLPEEVTKGDTNVDSESSSNSQEIQDEQLEDKPEKKPEEKPEEKIEEKPEEKPEEKIEEKPDANDDTKSDGERKTDDENSKLDGEEPNSKEGSDEKKTDSNEKRSGENEKKSENSDETKDGEKAGDQEEKVEKNNNQESDENTSEKKENGQPPDVFPSGAQSELLNETTTQNSAWSTQAAESKNEKQAQTSTQQTGYSWKLCNVTAGPDYIPCLDNLQAIRSLRTTKHYEHRERHCPDEAPTCLVRLPEGYRRPIEWPKSREKVCSVQLREFIGTLHFFFLK